MRVIRLLVAESPLAFAAAIIAGGLGGVALTAAVAGINTLLNTDAWHGFGSPSIIAAYLGAAILVGALSYGSGHAMSWLMQRRIAELRRALCARVLMSRLAQVESVGQPAIVALLSEDIMRLANGAFALPILVVNASICVAVLVYIALLNPILFGVVAAAQIATILVMWIFLRRFRVLIEQATTPRQVLMDHFHLLTSAIKELKQSRPLRVAFSEGLYHPNVEAVQRAANRINRLGVGMDAVAKIGFLLSIGLLLFVVAENPALATTNELRNTVVAFMFMVTPLATVLNNVPELFEANESLLKIDRFALDTETVGNRPFNSSIRTIGLSDTTYRYADAGRAGFMVGPISLSLARGEIVVLAGGNGSGKTTVAKLLTGLYLPLRGAQAIDGMEIGGDDLETYREHIGAIWSDNTQNHYRLSDQPAARNTGATTWKALGLDAVLPFATGWIDCSALSTGQRRRVALVSLLMEQRPFFVLDEWAANQDKQYRNLFYSVILPDLRARGHGVLVIAHDHECRKCANRVIEMRDGKISTQSIPELPGERSAAWTTDIDGCAIAADSPFQRRESEWVTD